MKLLLESMMQINDQTIAQAFYQQYLIGTLEHVLAVVTDSSQAQVAGMLFCVMIITFIINRRFDILR